MASSSGEMKDLGLQVAITECAISVHRRLTTGTAEFLHFGSSDLYRNSLNDSGITEDAFSVSSKVGYSLRLCTDKRISSRIIEAAISMILSFSHILLASLSDFHLSRRILWVESRKLTTPYFPVRFVINISSLHLSFNFSLKYLGEYPSSPSKNVF